MTSDQLVPGRPYVGHDRGLRRFLGVVNLGKTAQYREIGDERVRATRIELFARWCAHEFVATPRRTPAKGRRRG